MIFIYALSDPRTGFVRYVGKTELPKLRFMQHVNGCGGNLHRKNWIAGLLKAELLPVFEILEQFEDGEQWEEAERWWIAYLRFIGSPLLNLDAGGRGGNRRSAETRAKLSQANKRAYSGSVIREQVSKRVRAHYSNPEVIVAHSKVMSEIGSRDSVIKARTTAAKKRWADPSWKARTIERMRTPDNRRKLSESSTGRSFAPNALEKISKIAKERANRPENRAIYSERAKRFNARRFEGKWSDAVLISMAIAA